jgi:hypothetical protein
VVVVGRSAGGVAAAVVTAADVVTTVMIIVGPEPLNSLKGCYYGRGMVQGPSFASA